MRHAAAVTLVVLVVALASPLLADGVSVAREIKSALDSGDLGRAFDTWEMEKTVILDSTDAAFQTGESFAEFGCTPEVLRYRDLPGNCADVATECIAALDKALPEDDRKGRLRLGRLMLKAAWLLRKCGKGVEADQQEDGARVHLEAVTAGEGAEAEALVALGQVHVALVEREPPKAEEHLAKAAALFARAREASGDSAYLRLCEGRLCVRRAELKSDAMEKDPKDRALPKAVVAAYEDALDAFAGGLKLSDKDQALKTAYNECLWMCLRHTGGKSSHKPRMKDVQSRYRKIRLQLPDSEFWQVTANEKLEEDDVFEAWKWNEKAGKGLVILVTEYRWDTNYRNPETNEVVGGDNIGGLAKRSDRDVRAYFEDVKEREPLRKARLKKIPKVEAFSVKGKTKDGDLCEWRSFFFKHSKIQKTYRFTVIATLGMEEHNPCELPCILDTLELSEK